MRNKSATHSSENQSGGAARLLPIVLIALCGLMLIILMVIFPETAISAAVRGLSIWWDILFPALLPFFVISEMLLGFGIVHFLGALLDPLMRPVFRVPGIGGFVMAMGFASGYPVGARLTSQLWEQGLVNRDEGERLVAFTTSSDPIFLIGAVSIGFFHDPGLAGILALAHYGACVLIGFMMRYHGDPQSAKSEPTGDHDEAAGQPASGSVRRTRLRRAFEAMHQARLRDGRTVGLLLQQSIQSGIRLIIVVGGLVVFFSVLLELLTDARAMALFYGAVHAALSVFAIPEALSDSVVNGFFEVTLGARSAGEAGGSIQLVDKVAVAAFVLSWAGLSVHAQIASIWNNTNFRYRPFLFARVVHGLLAATMVYALWKPMQPVAAYLREMGAATVFAGHSADRFSAMFLAGGFVFAGSLAAVAVSFIIYSLYKRVSAALRRNAL